MGSFTELIKQARFIWICGNGGSASTAEHFATDLVKKGYPAIALTNTSVITMMANDYGYERIFSKQLSAYGSKDDLLITISCSGTSENIRRAKQEAKYIGMKVYSFETFSRIKDFGLLENEHLRVAHEMAEAL